MLADNLKYFYSKNNSPLLLQRGGWSSFRHYHHFYYHSQCLKTKIEFVFGGVVLADSPKVFPFSKNEAPPPVLVQRVKLNPFRNYHCFNYHSQCLRSKIKFVWGCGASREYERIFISKNKALLYYFKWLTVAHLYITIDFTITDNV